MGEVALLDSDVEVLEEGAHLECARIMLQRKILTGTSYSSCSCRSSTSHAHLVHPYLNP